MALRGVTVLELAGLAPGPYCSLLLAQHGANVVRVDRSSGMAKDPAGGALDCKRSVALDLKSTEGVRAFKRLAERADVLIEPYRPGVMEKMGLGPEALLALNPRLVYARLTGFGQSGPLAQTAGHDINYLGFTGALGAFRRAGASERPLAPVNLLGDFAGGGMNCALGIMLALVERASSGRGQVVDANMVDGVAHLSSFVYRLRAAGAWSDVPGTNVLDTGAPFYDVYTCKDGQHMAVGCIEPEFYKLMLLGLGLDKDAELPSQMDVKRWPLLRARLTAAFLASTRDEWTRVFSGALKDACVTPVLSLAEAPEHPAVRDSFVRGPGGAKDVMPAPVPRLSRTPGIPSPMGPGARPKDGANTVEVLKEFGFSDAEVAALLEGGHAVTKVGKPKAKL
jgi:alpha-methylacyl-CoA racemase